MSIEPLRASRLPGIVREIEQPYSAVPMRGQTVAAPDHLKLADGHEVSIIGDHSWRQVAETLKVPSAYLLSRPVEDRAAIAQMHFNRGFDAAAHDIITRGGEFAGFRRNDLTHLNLTDVAEAVLDGLGGAAEDMHTKEPRRSGHTVTLELVSPRVTEQVEVGDHVQAGVAISACIIGSHSTQVQVFTFRLICENGLLLRGCSKKFTRPRRLKDPCKMKQQISRLTAERWAAAEGLLNDMKALPGRTFEAVGHGDNPEHAGVRRFLTPYLRKGNLISKKHWDIIFESWEHPHGGEGKLTAYGVVNALTHAATHNEEFDFRRRQLLSRVAGMITASNSHYCPNCGSQLS